MLMVNYFNTKEEAANLVRAATDFGYQVAAIESVNPMVPGKWIVRLGLSPVLQGLIPKLSLFQKADGRSMISGQN